MKTAAYTRLETDHEFRTRVFSVASFDYATAYQIARSGGDTLDELVWLACKKQRRIIEVFP